MEIAKKQIVLTTLRPSEGYYLTRADRQDNQEVILSKEVILGKTDTPENWKEITIEEGDRLQAEVNARLMQEMEVQNGNQRN